MIAEPGFTMCQYGALPLPFYHSKYRYILDIYKYFVTDFCGYFLSGDTCW